MNLGGLIPENNVPIWFGKSIPFESLACRQGFNLDPCRLSSIMFSYIGFEQLMTGVINNLP
jgi:hypothetical protein